MGLPRRPVPFDVGDRTATLQISYQRSIDLSGAGALFAPLDASSGNLAGQVSDGSFVILDIEAEQRGSQVAICVRDDGAGIDPHVLRRRAQDMLSAGWIRWRPRRRIPR